MSVNQFENPFQAPLEVPYAEPALDLVQEAILAYAYSGQPFTMEAMRREAPVIADMSRKEYKQLEASFQDDRWAILDYLEEQGVVATWGIGDEVVTKNTPIALIKATSAPEIQITEPVVPPKPAAVPAPQSNTQQKPAASHPKPWESRPIFQAKRPIEPTIEQADPVQQMSALEFLRAARFATRLETGIARILEGNEGHRMRTSALIDRVSDELGTRKKETEQMIGEYVTRGHFFESKTRGYKYTEAAPSAETNISQSQGEADRKPEAENPNAINEDDIVIGSMAFDKLVSLRDIKQGLFLKTLVKEVKRAQENDPRFESEMSEQDIRRSIRRIAKREFLSIDETSRVTFASKELRDRVKHDKGSVMVELKELIGA